MFAFFEIIKLIVQYDSSCNEGSFLIIYKEVVDISITYDRYFLFIIIVLFIFFA